MHIGGRQVLASAGEFELRSPLDSSILLGYFQKGTAEFARKALEAANENFESWSNRPWTERVALVRKAADMIEKRQFYLAALIPTRWVRTGTRRSRRSMRLRIC